MTYIYKGQQAQFRGLNSDQIRAKLENIRRLEAAIQAEEQAKEKELQRIKAARKRLQPVATYAPTAEALAYREQYGHIIAAQPTPMHGGIRGLRMAAAEAAAHDARKNGRVA